MTPGIKEFTKADFQKLKIQAKRSGRARMSFNLHQSFEDKCQRLFNAVGVDSYIQPHRHSLDPKVETLIAVQGLFSVVIFDDVGKIQKILKFGTEKFSDSHDMAACIEISPGVWHTVVALVDQSILFEVKEGIFIPQLAKELAPWAPSEDDPRALTYLQWLRNLCT